LSKGKLLIISGFSGVGKGTTIGRLMKQNPGKYAFSVSATTRAPRPGELDGREYFFVTKERFEEMIREDAFLEYAQYTTNYYGTPVAPVMKQLEAGGNVILDIEVQGAMNVKARYPEAVTIFMMPPSAEVLFKRLTGRGTETMEQVLGRMGRSLEETELVTGYDHFLVNDDLQTAVDELKRLSSDDRIDETERAKGLEKLARVRKELAILLKEQTKEN